MCTKKPKPIRKGKSGSNFRRNFLDMDDDDTPGRVTLKIGEQHYPTPKKTKKSTPKKIKYEPIEVDDDFLTRPDLDLMLNTSGDGELKIDLPLEYDDSEMPILASEEIIEESLLDEEDGATEVTTLNSISRIKSQAESTYMMEKSRKGTSGNSYHSNSPQSIGTGTGTGTPRLKVKKKKGPPRTTGYLLWAKDYRAQFANKYPTTDFATVSKSLSEQWAGVPGNQKKMWKARAAKESKKGENIKNSAPKPVTTPKTPKKAKRKLTTAAVASPAGQEIFGKNDLPIPIRRGGGGSPKKKKSNTKNTKGADSFTIGAPAKTNSKSITSSSKSLSGGGGARGGLIMKADRKSPGKGKSKSPSNLSLNLSRISLNATPGSSTIFQYSPQKDDIPSYKPTSTNPVDVAAHFSLLGESLGIIGERLKEHEGPNISGSLSVMLDSFLCATAPLLCLTQQVPELNHIPPEKLSRMMDNIAYLMPGL